MATLVVAGLTSLSALPASAQTTGPNLNVSPKRVVLSSDQRTAAIYVFNQGDAAATYTVSLTDRVMTPDGQIRTVDDPDLKATGAAYIAKLASAQPMITFTPRRVTLRPGQSQVIRLRIDRPATATAAEYHTHLTVTALPPESAGFTADEAAAANPNALVTKISTQFSISIALIVRNGATVPGGELSNVSYQMRQAPGPAAAVPTLSVDLLRKGGNSLYGDFEVREAGAPRNAAPIGLIRGIGVYAEVDHRLVDIPLTKTPAKGARLEIAFKDDDTKPGTVLATTVFTVP